MAKETLQARDLEIIDDPVIQEYNEDVRVHVVQALEDAEGLTRGTHIVFGEGGRGKRTFLPLEGDIAEEGVWVDTGVISGPQRRDQVATELHNLLSVVKTHQDVVRILKGLGFQK